MRVHPCPQRRDEDVVAAVPLLRVFAPEIAAELREVAARDVGPHPEAHVLEITEEIVACLRLGEGDLGIPCALLREGAEVLVAAEVRVVHVADVRPPGVSVRRLLANLEGELVGRLASGGASAVGPMHDAVAVVAAEVHLVVLDTTMKRVEVGERLVAEEVEAIGRLLRGQGGIRRLPVRVPGNPQYARGCVNADRDGDAELVVENAPLEDTGRRDRHGQPRENELEVPAVENG